MKKRRRKRKREGQRAGRPAGEAAVPKTHKQFGADKPDPEHKLLG